MPDIQSKNSAFLKASDALMFLVQGIVKPQNVTGFVYSFFFDTPFPLEPLYVHDSVLKYTSRDSDLFIASTKEIILTSEEIKYINDKFFTEKLIDNYNQLFQGLDMFHRHFRESIDPQNLIEVYNSLLVFLDSEKGEYSFSQFNSINGLDIFDFKKQAINQYFDFKEAVMDKINSLRKKVAIIFPSRVFIDVEYYNRFKEYQKKYIDNPYNDYSFLFKQMSDLKMMHRLTFKEATEWLYEEGYIDKQTSEEFYIKGSFNTKAISKERLRNFKIIFENE